MPAIRSKDTKDHDCPTLSAKIVPSPRTREDTKQNASQTCSGRVLSALSAQYNQQSSGTSVSANRGIKNHGKKSTTSITVCGVQLRSTVAFDTFWRVAAERKAIDDKRRAGEPAPWTNDPILRDNFFCNTYRVLDKLSQYLISEVIEKGPQTPEEVVFRILLFHSFTRIETWELLANHCGPLEWKTYNHNKYKKVLEDAFKAGQTLYTSAFVKPAPHFVSSQNYVNHLHLLETMMNNQLASRLLGAPNMADVYEYIISFPSMGPFMSYQLMLCLSYSDVLNFHHNDFVIAGPGSISGLNKLFSKKSMYHGRTTVVGFDAEVMRYMANTQNEHFERLGLQFSGLGPERLPMGVADIEHTLCEVDKYCRAAHPELPGKKKHLVRSFKPSPNAYTPSTPSPAILPKAWSHPARLTPRIREDKVLRIEKRYEVERLADHRDTPDGRQYFVYWVGYSAKDASWEFESSLVQDTPDSVEEYLAGLKKNRSRTSKKRN